MPAPSDLVHETATTTGTGNFTLVNVNGKRSFNTAFGTGGSNLFDYFISNQSAAEWERGTGHLSAASTLVRDTVLASSNANAAVSFGAGTKDVTNDIPAANQARLDATQTWSGGNTFSGDISVEGNSALGNAAGDALIINCKSVTSPNMVAVLAYNSADDVDVTGDGTAVTVDFDTEITDRGGDFSADTFTAPVTGIYRLVGAVFLLTMSAGHVVQVELVTSNRIYFVALEAVSVASKAFPYAIDNVDMDSADTAFLRLTVLSGTKTVDVDGASSPTTFFCANLTG